MEIKIKHTAQEICDALDINIKDVMNIYPYGSQVYGTATKESDHDYIIVYKRSILPSGAFKDNAISSKDRMIQGSCYSKGGFLDAINNYQISTLECIFLPEELVVKNMFKFKLNKYVEKECMKKIITTASASAHSAKLAHRDDHIESSKKNMYHALRIIQFGMNVKDHQVIVDYGASNETKKNIYEDEEYDFNSWWKMFVELSNDLKK